MRTKSIFALLLFGLCLSAGAASASAPVPAKEAREIAKEAYIFNYPLP